MRKVISKGEDMLTQDAIMCNMAECLDEFILTPKAFDDIVDHLKWFYFGHIGENVIDMNAWSSNDDSVAALAVNKMYLSKSGPDRQFYVDGSCAIDLITDDRVRAEVDDMIHEIEEDENFHEWMGKLHPDECF